MYKKDFTLIKGETFTKEISVTVNKVIYPLVGFTALSELRPYPGSKELTETFSCEVFGEDGVVKITLTSEQTNRLPKGIQYYDIILVNSETNERLYLIGGRIIIKNHVTELQQ